MCPHVLFILIDGNLVWLLLRPPMWLVWPYAVLTLQVLNGHGRSAWEQWHEAGRIDGIPSPRSSVSPWCSRCCWPTGASAERADSRRDQPVDDPDRRMLIVSLIVTNSPNIQQAGQPLIAITATAPAVNANAG